ncbi:unnamed protein product [Urochloa decumbens]|uniref:F-box domain-containing protein n=1 Tax=Urochloa decumbens TaxID=240449 RepID=A0ABC9GLR4_9POAL
MPPPSPELADYLLGEIFLRLPPEDIACLLRASLACKRWRRILADPAFRRRHREIHRTPRVLGFFRAMSKDLPYLSRYVPDNPASRRPAGCDLPGWLVLDCRHGRALFATPSPSLSTEVILDFLVWDPLTGEQRHLPRPSPPPTQHPCSAPPPRESATTVAAMGGHSSWPFLFTTWIRNSGYITSTCVYSSETGGWNELTSIDNPDVHIDDQPSPSTLAGDTLYFCGSMTYTFEYQLGAQRLSIMDRPPLPQQYRWKFIFLISMEDGRLGCADMELEPSLCLRLRLWSRETAPDGFAHWSPGRGFEVETLLPSGALLAPRFTRANPPLMPKADVCGFAEGTDVIFVGTNTHIGHTGAVYMVQLNSGKARKVFDGLDVVFPYTSFCIPVIDAACTEGSRGVSSA